MMKMLFKLNEEKIKADGKTVEEIWAIVESAFVGREHWSEKLADGSVEYSAPDNEDEGNVFGIALARLAIGMNFIPYCKKWTWTEYDDDGEIFEEDDVYEDVKDGKFGMPDD